MECVICSGEIPAKRIKLHPNVLTCGQACRKRHHMNLIGAWNRRRRKELQEAGLCMRCGEVPSPPGQNCPECRAINKIKKEVRKERAA